MPKSPQTLLLVEDEAIIAFNEKIQLEGAGYHVIHSLSGEKAAQIANDASNIIDLILMDIDLGEGIDGTEAARRILRTKDVPVVFLSSHMEPETVSKTEEITNYGYVVKSSVFTVLDASIKMAFRLFASKKQLALNGLEIEEKNRELEDSLEKLKKTYEDLALSEDKFSKAFHENPDSIIITRMSDGTILNVNQGFSLMYGYSPEEVIGRSSLPGDLDIWAHPEDREMSKPILVGKTKIANFETEFRRKDGAIFRGLISAHVIIIDGEDCVISTTRDITERKNLEDELRVKSRLLDNVGDSIQILDLDGNIVYINESVCRNTGYSRDELIGKNITILDTPAGKNASKSVLEEVIRNGSARFQTQQIRKDGTIYMIDVICVLETTEKKHIISVVRDITEQKKAEEELKFSEIRYKALLSHITDVVGIMSKDGVSKYVSPNIEKFFGWNPMEVTGDGWSHFHPDDLPRLRNDFENLVASPTGTVKSIEFRGRNKSGTYRFIEMSAINYLDDPVINGVLYSFRDITERKEKELEIKNLLDEKEVVLKEVHHRVKNSMVTIKSLVSLQGSLLKDPIAISASDDTLNRINSMIALYEYLSISSSYNHVHLKAFLFTLVNKIIETFPDSESVHIEQDITEMDLGTSQAQTLGIVINELLTNIMKYAFANRSDKNITVLGRCQNDTIFISIRDNGNGIPDSIDFYHTPSLGLMLVRELVRQLDGKISIERKNGTKILIEFPKK